MIGAGGERATAAADFDRLDALSRQRALTDAESLMLERAALLAEGRRLPSGLTKALVRHGIKRDMRHFASV